MRTGVLPFSSQRSNSPDQNSQRFDPGLLNADGLMPAYKSRAAFFQQREQLGDRMKAHRGMSQA
jgi:hypothetical protein